VDAGRLVKSSVETFAERTGMRVRLAEGEAGKGQRAERGGAGGGNGIELRVENNLPMVNGDRGALAKVVLNLLDNAVKYGRKELPISGEGSGNRSRGPEKEKQGPEKESDSCMIEVAVSAAAMRGRSWVKVAVRDHGIGIERKELKKIFRKFYRVSSGPQRGIRGVGLGLALCRDIVKAHKGRIEVESRPGKGSVFTVCLPGSGARG
jgi:two-component system phosphate regulon sensor histidine kinase PhoR